MKEYIERAAVLDKTQEIYHWAGYESRYDEFVSCEDIRNIPAADVAEVRHGRWIFDHMTGEWSYYSHCSECNHQEFFANRDAEKRHKYCLNCGARMDKEDEDEAM